MRVEIEFTCYRPDARAVHLLGDFNDWDTSSLPMQRTESGSWIRRVTLSPGPYLYRYLIQPAGSEEDWFSDCEDPLLGVEWSPVGANAVVVVGAGDDGATVVRTGRRATGKASAVAAARVRGGHTLKINEQEQDMLRCFRLLPDDHARSEIVHFIRDFARFDQE